MTFGQVNLSRAIDAGVNPLYVSDYQLSIDASSGNVTIVLPPISDVIAFSLKSGKIIGAISYLISRLKTDSSSNTITLICDENDSINGVASVVVAGSGLLNVLGDNSWDFQASV